jgi:hypothetical protein
MTIPLTDSNQTSGTSTSISIPISTLLPSAKAGDWVVVGAQIVGVVGTPVQGAGWILGFTDGGWDGGNERFLSMSGQVGVVSSIDITWNGAPTSWCLVAGSYRSLNAVFQNATGGFNSYTWPSASGIKPGGALVHVKGGDKDDEVGACPIGSNPFVNVQNIQVGGVGSADLQHSLSIPTGSFTGLNVGNDKGVGSMFRLDPIPYSSSAMVFRRIRQGT